LIYLAVVQVCVGLLDLLGVAIVGVIGALAINGIQSMAPGNRVGHLLKILHLNEYTFQTQVAILGSLAMIVLVLRTIISITLTRRSLRFISRKSALITSKISERILAQNLIGIQKNSLQQTTYAISNGINTITLGVVGNAISLLSDLFLLVILSSGLFLFDIQIALFTLIFFGSIAGILYKVLQSRARFLGNCESEINVEVNQLVFDAMNSFREIYVKGLRQNFVNQITERKLKLSEIVAEISFLPNISKYVIEASLIVGAFLVCALQFLQFDSKHAFASLTIFLAAASRIAPAALRVQQGLVSIKNNLGSANSTLQFIKTLELNELPKIDSTPRFEHGDFKPNISISEATFRYPENESFTLGPVSLEITPGQVVAFVGSSGSGKTTLADLILGVIKPIFGEVKIHDLSPEEAILLFPGSIGYVPQDIQIRRGNVLENVAFGFDETRIYLTEIQKSLSIARLESVVQNLSEGVETQIGDRGFRLSGGQRQRLGIARAMFTNPTLLVLDEATSALDGITEEQISEEIGNLKGLTTVVIIAHRLATVKNVDVIFYMESGKVIATGSFEEVKAQVPEFAHQARIAGL